ncbi:MAG: sulfatase-like hydrolase/transferase [Lentisphaerales bacterium]|nr:sulfatase-like hydrolase/transferase [Lentisphaerales bacterium]
MDDVGWAQTSVKMMDSEPLSVSNFYETPNLEKLAARGMKFSNAYAPTPTCTGSRVSIQFGKTSARMQYRFVHDVLSYKQRPNGYKDEVSIAGMLKATNKNYITAHFGKGISVEQLKDVGYDITDEYEEIAANGNFHGEYIDIQSKEPLPENDPKRIYSLTKESLKFLDEYAGKQPFYMMISHYAVHGPQAASPHILKKWQKKYDALSKPSDKNELRQFERLRTPMFASMIDESDAHLGKLMEMLKEKGELENTYIIYTSDNGAEWTPMNTQKQRYNGPLTQGKYFPFEGGLRIPFVVAGPGIPAGIQCDTPIVQWDLLPTFHDLAESKQALPAGVDGGSLRAVFTQGNAAPAIKRQAPGLVFHFPSYYQPPISSIRIGDFKLMHNLNTGEMRLYNVKTDYREKNNLINEMPEKAAAMAKTLGDYVKSVNGGEVEDVYQAAIDLFNEFDRRAKESYEKKLASAKSEAEKQQLKEAYEKKLRSNMVKREMIKDQRKSGNWHGSAAKKTMTRLGIKKDGTFLKKK